MRATATASTDSASTTGLAGRDHLAPPAGRPGPLDHVELLLRQIQALLQAGDPLGAREARAR
ncbi:hypothetical protein, partial [Streptosporangium sp. NPDC050280]|uniref:hypothetical protein n=1 Tax=Streptosporangium sp. NPDC050280 TaxID=3154934 RepID=UPI003432FB32